MAGKITPKTPVQKLGSISEICWGRFMADQERIHSNALELLNSYYHWWVLGIGKEKEKRKPNSIDENLLFADELITASAGMG